jgi:erythromycin esterase-like protein
MRERFGSSFVSWAGRAAIRLPDPLGATPELTAFLSGALREKRLLFVGEADHFIREKIEYRLAFAEAALRAGFDCFGEELGRSDGLRIDRYLRGETDSLDDITLFGNRREIRPDRDDSPTGILQPSYEKPADARFRFEHERLLTGLRALREQAPDLSLFGFDVDGLPGGAYADLERWLGVPLPHALQRVPGETLPQEVERLTTFLNAGVLSDMNPRARTSLETLRDSLHYTSLAHPAATWPALAPAMAFRERVMHRHVDTALAALPRERGLVLWGHDFHLARDDDGITGRPGSVGPGGDSERSLGHHLCKQHGDDVFIVWMVFGGGEDSQPLQGLSRRLRPRRGSLNAILGRVGGNFVLPTRSTEAGSEPLREPLRLYHLYNGYAEVRIADQADAICFIENVSPMRSAR